MAHRYLNRDDKETALTLGATKTYLDQQIVTWAKLKRPAEVMKNLRAARTFVGKTLSELFRGLDDEEVAQVVTSQRSKMVVTIERRLLPEYQEAQRQVNDRVVMASDDFLDLCAKAINECTRCTRQGDDADQCGYKRIFIKYDVEPLDLEAPVGKCPYQYN